MGPMETTALSYTHQTQANLRRKRHQGLRRPWHLRISLLTRMQSILLNLRKLPRLREHSTHTRQQEIIKLRLKKARWWWFSRVTLAVGRVFKVPQVPDTC